MDLEVKFDSTEGGSPAGHARPAHPQGPGASGRSTAAASSSAFGSCLTSCLRTSKALSTQRSTGPGQRGWISSKWGVTETGRRAKFYTLTKAGGKQLTAEEESWDRLTLAIAKVRKAV